VSLRLSTGWSLGVMLLCHRYRRLAAQSKVSMHDHSVLQHYSDTTCHAHITGTETCETSPEECHLDQICGVHMEGNCSECYCTPGYSGEECISKHLVLHAT